MRPLIPLTLAVPLVTAAVLVAAGRLIGRRTADALSVAASGASTVMAALLTTGTGGRPLVYWFGGWSVRDGFPVGIAFVVDRLSAGLAAFAGLSVTLTLVFCWRYFEQVRPVYHGLMLTFQAGMAGFALSGDFFNLFVFFELMGVTAYALTAYKVEESRSLQGGINFAVVNSIGGFVFLHGLALVYARTGTLNMAAAGEALAGARPDGLVTVAFLLLTCGLLVKAAVVPFHFWLSDAYAAAPTPFAAMFSAVMVELGLYGVARVFWATFDGVLSAGPLRGVLVPLGVATALVGGSLAVLQDQLKRLLAFATIAHTGVALVGVGLLDARALAGAALFVVGDGLAKALLFYLASILRHRAGSVGAGDLSGRGRDQPLSGALMALGAMGLAGLPPIAGFLGVALIEKSATHHHFPWVPYALAFASALSAGAVLAAAGRIFLGWGRGGQEREEAAEEEEPETTGGRGRTPAVMAAPALLVATGLVAIGVVPGVIRPVLRAAEAFASREFYARLVLEGVRLAVPPVSVHGPALKAYLIAAGAVVASFVVAAAILRPDRVPGAVSRSVDRTAGTVVRTLHRVHSGHVGDYVAWLLLGLAVLGGSFAVVLR